MSRQMLNRRGMLGCLARAGAGALLAGGSTVAYTLWIEPHWVQVVPRTIPIPDLPEHWRGRRLIHLSDLHLGPRVSDDYLLRVFETTRALQPDVVAYTGDFIDWEPNVLDHAARILPHLPTGKFATVGVLGNHDYGRRWADTALADDLSALLESVGVRMLPNRWLDTDGLILGGLDDVWADRHNVHVLAATFPGGRPVVLAHNPDLADIGPWDRMPGWILSGHTHGGQCKPPFLPPPILPVKNKRYAAGEYAVSGGRRLYINRGIGHLVQARFNARPEITVFTLDRGPDFTPE